MTKTATDRQIQIWKSTMENLVAEMKRFDFDRYVIIDLETAIERIEDREATRGW